MQRPMRTISTLAAIVLLAGISSGQQPASGIAPPPLPPLEAPTPQAVDPDEQSGGVWLPELPDHDRVAVTASDEREDRALDQRLLEDARAISPRVGHVWLIVLVAGLALFGLLVGAWTALRRG